MWFSIFSSDTWQRGRGDIISSIFTPIENIGGIGGLISHSTNRRQGHGVICKGKFLGIAH